MGISRLYLLKVLVLLIFVAFGFFYFYASISSGGYSRSGTGADGTSHSDSVQYGSPSPLIVDDRTSHPRNEDSEKDEEEEEKLAFSDITIHVAMIFTKADGNLGLKLKFSNCLESMLNRSSRPIHLHLIGDQPSLSIASQILQRGSLKASSSLLKVTSYSAEIVGAKTDLIVGQIRKYFMYKPGAYYSDSLFFFSIVMHKIFAIERIIVLDVDLKFRTNVAQLWEHFDRFESHNLIGIAHEQQPVYRHIFHMYRKDHPSTEVGDPLPGGMPGFNSAVLLLDLQRMRNSREYANLLNVTFVENLVAKYKFQGHLGDQDFFTLIGLDHASMFYILPCGWNRQLCQWWKVHGYKDVFQQYHRCTDDIKILHGNCNTPIPD